MAEVIYIKELGRVKKVKREIERALNVKLTITSNGIEISDDQGMNTYVALKVLEAVDMGFQIQSALKLQNEDTMFEKISIKQHARPSRLSTIKGRLIGKKGKALATLSELTGCDMKIQDYEIGLIGKTSDLKFAINALINLIHGSPHSNVYAYLEKSRHLREVREDEQENFLKNEGDIE